MGGAVRLAGVVIAGALLVAAHAPASAGYYGQVYESYKGARSYARTRARKVCRQELDYRASERQRLARLGIPRYAQPPPWLYASPWGACTAPGLF
jgi:hypothetical protein